MALTETSARFVATPTVALIKTASLARAESRPDRVLSSLTGTPAAFILRHARTTGELASIAPATVEGWRAQRKPSNRVHIQGGAAWQRERLADGCVSCTSSPGEATRRATEFW